MGCNGRKYGCGISGLTKPSSPVCPVGIGVHGALYSSLRERVGACMSVVAVLPVVGPRGVGARLWLAA